MELPGLKKLHIQTFTSFLTLILVFIYERNSDSRLFPFIYLFFFSTATRANHQGNKILFRPVFMRKACDSICLMKTGQAKRGNKVFLVKRKGKKGLERCQMGMFFWSGRNHSYSATFMTLQLARKTGSQTKLGHNLRIANYLCSD